MSDKPKRSPEYNSLQYPQGEPPNVLPEPARPPENEPRDSIIILILVLCTMLGIAILAVLKRLL